MIKTQVLTITDGVIVPNAGVNTFTVADFDTPTGILIETNRLSNQISLLRQDYAGTSWRPVTDKNGAVILKGDNCEAIINMPGVYALAGKVEGTLLAYTLTI